MTASLDELVAQGRTALRAGDAAGGREVLALGQIGDGRALPGLRRVARRASG